MIMPHNKLVLQKLLEHFDTKVLSADIIVGDNHGQGSFCSPVKIVIVSVDHKKLWNADFERFNVQKTPSIYHIKCWQDQ